MKNLLIIGAGGHGKVCYEIALNMKKWDTINFLDDFKTGKILDSTIIGKSESIDFNPDEADIFIAIGDNYKRETLHTKFITLGYRIPTLISTCSYISKYCFLGEGTVVMNNSIINTSAHISRGCIINSGSILEHDSVIGEFCHVSPGSVILGGVHIGDFTWIGANATIKNNVEIASNSVIGAGAVVVKNISEEGIYVGLPAKKIK